MASRQRGRSGGGGRGSGRERRTIVKDEPVDDDELILPSTTTSADPTAVASSSVAPPTTTSTTTTEGEQQHQDGGHPDDEENDKVVREIGVYISPSLSSTLTLVQFPLQPATPGPTPPPPNQKHSRPPPPPPPPPLPESARIKPRHNILELDYTVPTHDYSTHRSIPDALHLIQRTYTSSTVDPVTHMALGRFDLSGSRLDIIPLRKSIMQMRPTFRHVDALYDDGSPEEAEPTSSKEEPLKFKKKESDRAALARRSSYAYKKASEASEEFVDLMVCPMGTEEGRTKSREVVCPRKDVALKFMTKTSGVTKKGGADGSHSYIKSLNYLPMADLIDEDENEFESLVNLDAPLEKEEVVDKKDDDSMLDEGEEQKGGEIMSLEERIRSRRVTALKELTTRLTQLLHNGYGGPTPYKIIRSKYPPSIIADDTLLLEALSSCAVLVRGNFILKSNLLVDASAAVRDARDLILFLLNRDGRVLREKLMGVFGLLLEDKAKKKEKMTGEEDDNHDDEKEAENMGDGANAGIHGDVVTHDILESLLRQVARKDVNSWVSKVDDDYSALPSDADGGVGFGVKASEIAGFHAAYWERKCEMLQDLIHKYDYGADGEDDAMEDFDGDVDGDEMIEAV